MFPPERRREQQESDRTVADIKARKISLVSLEERSDTTSAAGELVFHVLGTIAQFERRLISQRTKYELATARNHGRIPGRHAIAARNNLSPARSR